MNTTGIVNVVWATVLALFLAMGFEGCTNSTLDRVRQADLVNLSPDQIQALDAAGQAVVACLQIGGPPPLGSGSILVVPKQAAGSVEFAADCHPTTKVQLQATVFPPRGVTQPMPPTKPPVAAQPVPTPAP